MLRSWIAQRVPTREEVSLGPRGGFSVSRDTFGNPTVIARSVEEVAVGWGYACASDRLFQMTRMRRILRGTMAALVGDGRAVADTVATSDLDLLARTMDFVEAARLSYQACSINGRDLAARYADGVNLWIQRHGVPLECRVIGETPTAWLAEDCTLVAKGFALIFTRSWADALASSPSARAIGSMIDLLRAALGAGPTATTGNAIAIASNRSRTGSPLVAMDFHFPLAAPCTLWEVALVTRELRYQGISVPGSPLAIAGQTASVAWGITARLSDDVRVHPEERLALALARVRNVVIPRKGQSDRIATIRSTKRGPLISDSVPGGVDRDSHAYSIQWTGFQATRELDASIQSLRATDIATFCVALSAHSSPSVNAVFADRDGDIGWQPVGEALAPTGQYRTSEAPTAGVLVSANTSPDAEFTDDSSSESSFRHRRWSTLLASEALLGPDELISFQRDLTSGWARELAGILALHVDMGYRQRLSRWDGNAHRGSNTAAVFYATLRELLLELEALDGVARPGFTSDTFTHSIRQRLDQPDGNRLVSVAVARAEKFLTTTLGLPDHWRWGALHKGTFAPALRHSRVNWLLEIPPIEMGGDGSTISMSAFDPSRGFEVTVGAPIRMILDVNHPERSRAVVAPGASGHVRSLHYADQIDLWSEGKLRAMNGGWRS